MPKTILTTEIITVCDSPRVRVVFRVHRTEDRILESRSTVEQSETFTLAGERIWVPILGERAAACYAQALYMKIAGISEITTTVIEKDA